MELFFLPYCTFQAVEKNTCFHERGEKECVDICNRLNKIFSSSPLENYFGFKKVLITCPDENARGSRMLRTMFYKSSDLYPDLDSSNSRYGYLLDVKDPLVTENNRLKGIPVIVLHPEALVNDETLVTHILHELTHAKDFLYLDKLSCLIYHSPFQYFLNIILNFPIFSIMLILWVLLGEIIRNNKISWTFFLLDIFHFVFIPFILIVLTVWYLSELRTELKTYLLIKKLFLYTETKTSRKYIIKTIVFLMLSILTFFFVITINFLSDPYVKYFIFN